MRPNMEAARARAGATAKRVLCAVAMLVAIGAGVSRAASAASDSTAGLVVVDPGGGEGAPQLAFEGLVPEVERSRAVDVVNRSSSAYPSISLTITATRSSVLDTDRTNGIQIRVERCPSAWTARPDGAFGCDGTVSEVSGPGPIIGVHRLNGLASSAPRGVDHLLVTATLAANPGDEMKGASSGFAYTVAPD